MPNESPWLFSPTYANPNPVSKRVLWESLKSDAVQSPLPWLTAGDFNDVSTSAEKFGGSAFNCHRAKIFNDNIHACNLHDLGWNGNPFTWVGKRRNGLLVREQLDRALTSDDWCIRFPNTAVGHLPKVLSNHHPLLIDIHGNHSPSSSTKPFRFEYMWTHHPSFHDLLTNSWTPHAPVHANLSHLSTVLRDWNRDVFDNLFLTKKKLLRRIEGIQRTSSYTLNPFLLRLEDDLLAQYLRVLHQEEL